MVLEVCIKYEGKEKSGSPDGVKRGIIGIYRSCEEILSLHTSARFHVCMYM